MPGDPALAARPFATLDASLSGQGIAVQTADDQGHRRAHGWYRHDRRQIYIRPAAPAQMACVLVHEAAHALAHRYADGEAPMFELAAHYPTELVQIVNWHDRRAAPHLTDGQKLAHRCVAGGLNERSIVEARPETVAAEARDAIAQTGGRWLIVAPGCVIPVATPEANVRAAGEAVRG